MKTTTPETDAIDQSKFIFGASLPYYRIMAAKARELEREREKLKKELDILQKTGKNGD